MSDQVSTKGQSFEMTNPMEQQNSSGGVPNPSPAQSPAPSSVPSSVPTPMPSSVPTPAPSPSSVPSSVPSPAPSPSSMPSPATTFLVSPAPSSASCFSFNNEDDTVQSSNTEDDSTDPSELSGDSRGKKKTSRQRNEEEFYKGKDARVIKKKKDPCEFVEDLGKRTRLVCGRAPTLQRLAQELQVKSKANVYLKIEYTTPARRQPYLYSFGENFTMSGEEANQLPSPGPSPVKSSTPAPPPSPVEATGQTGSSIPESSPTVSGGLFDSPHSSQTRVARRQKFFSGPACFICNGTEPFVMIGGMKVDAPFFTYAHEPCQGKVHNDCAGFPSVDYEDIKLFAPWYCSIHKGAGRAPLEFSPVVLPTQAEETAASSAFASAARRSSGRAAAAKAAKASTGATATSGAKPKTTRGGPDSGEDSGSKTRGRGKGGRTPAKK